MQQTLDNLKQQDPTLLFPIDSDPSQDDSVDGLASRPESPIESRGVTELARLVDGLTRAVFAARERATPLSQQIGPLRLKLTDLKEQRDLKKQVSGLRFDAATTQIKSKANYSAHFLVTIKFIHKSIKL